MLANRSYTGSGCDHADRRNEPTCQSHHQSRRWNILLALPLPSTSDTTTLASTRQTEQQHEAPAPPPKSAMSWSCKKDQEITSTMQPAGRLVIR